MTAERRERVKTHEAIWTTRMFVKTKWINEILITFISRRGCNLHSSFIATCLRALRVKIIITLSEAGYRDKHL